jgi:hypothetical protein
MGGDRPADDDGPPVGGGSRVGLEAEADHVKDPRCVTRRTHARFTDFIIHFRMDWRSVCRGIDDSCCTVCGGIDGSCWTVCAGIGGSRGGVFCAINCFGAPLVGARGFLGFRPLLFGMEREPAAPAGSTLFTFQYIAEYTGPFGGSRPRHHGTELRSADPAEDTFVGNRSQKIHARDRLETAAAITRTRRRPNRSAGCEPVPAGVLTPIPSVATR